MILSLFYRQLRTSSDIDKMIRACIASMGEAVFQQVNRDGRKMRMEGAVASSLSEK